MNEDPKKHFRKAVEQIALNLDGLLRKLEQVLNYAVSRPDQAGTGQSEHSFDSSNGPVRAQAGMRVRVGALNGQAGATPQPVNPNRSRLTLVKLASADTPPSRGLNYALFQDDTVRILAAEMPGVSLEDVNLTMNDATLTLQSRGERLYRVSVPLPPPSTTALRHGILTLHFPKEVA